MKFIEPAFRRAQPWLPIAIGPLLLFGVDLIRGKALFWGTPLLQFTPWREAAKEIIFSGHLPLWNPWLGMGAPLLANYQSALLYPPNWILLAVDVSWGQTLLVMLHLVWAGIGMAWLGRSLGMGAFAQAIAGVAYAMSGYLVARSGFLSINAAAAWLPWILYAADGLARAPRARNVALLGLLLGMQWLAGHAQVAWYTLLLTAAWVAFHAWSNSPVRALLAFSAAGLLGFSIAAVQLLPTLEYVSVSNRTGELDPEFMLTYSFWPWRLSGLIAPDLFGSPGSADYWGFGNYWEDAIFVGVLPILLALGALFTKAIGRLRWFLLALAASAFFLSLGRNTPIFTFLFDNVPTFSLFQAPARWNLILIACLSLLAGLGAQHWQVAAGRQLYWLRLGTAGAGAVLAVGLLIGALNTGIEPTFIRSMAVAGFWLLVCGVLALSRTVPARAGWSAAVLSVVVLDLYFAGRGLNPTQPAELNSAPTALSQQVSSDHRLYMAEDLERELKFDVAFRFDSFQPELDWSIVRESGLPNTVLLDGLSSANNFDPIRPARYVEWMRQLELASDRKRLLPYMDVGWRAVGVPPDYEHLGSPTRAWIVPNAEWVGGSQQAIRRATDPGFNLSAAVVVEGEPRLEAGGKGDVISFREQGPNLVELVVAAPQGGWLVLADTWYPGWKTEIDGHATEAYPANGVMRATWVPAGEHTVSYRYRPVSLPLGLMISIAGLASFALLRRR